MGLAKLSELGGLSGVAGRAFCTRSHLHRILRGEARPSPELAGRLEAVTGVEAVAWLLPDRHPNPLVDEYAARERSRD